MFVLSDSGRDHVASAIEIVKWLITPAVESAILTKIRKVVAAYKWTAVTFTV